MSPWRHSGEERGGGHVREYLFRHLDNRVTSLLFSSRPVNQKNIMR